MTPTFAAKPAREEAAPGPLLPSGPPAQPKEHISAGPVPPIERTEATVIAPTSPPPLEGKAESLDLEQVNLATFIHEVFSRALKLTVHIDQRVMTRSDLVTLSTGKPLAALDLFRMATKILESYGVAASWDGSVLNIVPNDALMAQMPEIIRTRALPELPIAMRPIFQVVDLTQTSAADMTTLLANVYGSKVRIFPSAKANALLLFGLPEDVRAAVSAVQVLDQGRLAGRRSLRINPVYWSASKLAEQLVTLLKAEGYDAATSATSQAAAIMVIPVEANNSIIVLARDPKLLDHVRDWITELDQPASVDPQSNIFVYSVRNTTAATLGQTVLGVLGGTPSGAAPPPGAQLEQAGATRSTPNAPIGGLGGLAPVAQPGTGQSSSGSAGTGRRQEAGGPSPSATTLASGTRLIIDPVNNALIIVGSAQEYARIRPLLTKLDVPPLEVLIEVTVAEIDLTDTTNLGVEWGLLNHLGNGTRQSVGTLPTVITSTGGGGGGFGLPSGGFNYTFLNGVGQVRFALNALAQTNHINVLSTPRILAKSGAQASIQVGTQVPIVTSQATSSQISTGGTSGILQSIEYQQTGVLLTVNPVVHSGNRVDLSVDQEVSSALPNTTSGISSPEIQNRTIKTQLTLRDGQTVVIGGMIQTTRNDNDQGVPYLKDIPVLGLMFKSQSIQNDRTELLVFITPYVVSSDSDAAAITKDFRAQMGSWVIPPATLQW
ncbi:MAG TPA: type II secretion system secretin GspD [Stellaceae bacterium]|nr:type II secretion system secretin GspD [Stellaceae bacterium]